MGFKGSEAVKELDDGVLLEELTKPSLGKDSCLYCDEASPSFSEDSGFYGPLFFHFHL